MVYIISNYKGSTLLLTAIEYFVVINMKRTFLILLSIIIFALTGCGQDYSSEERTTEAVQNKFPKISYNSTEKPYYQNDNHIVAVAENGYYFVRNLPFSVGLDNFASIRYYRLESDNDNKSSASESYGKMLYYYDINSETVTPLCSKVNCKHNTVECEAYFDTVEGNSDSGGFVYYNKQIYMVAYDNKSGMKVVSYDEHGMNQKDESVISNDPEYLPYTGGKNDICIFNGNVYCWGIKNISSIENAALSEIVLFKTNLSSKKTEIIMTLQENAEQTKYTKDFNCDIEIANNKMYVKTCTYDKAKDMFTYILYETEDKEGKSFEEILRSDVPRDCNNRIDGENYSNLKSFAVDNEENVFYVDELKSEGLSISAVLCKYNIKTQETKVIYDLGEVVAYSVMCDDEYIYLNQFVGTFSEDSIKILDKEGQEKYVKIYTNEEPNGYESCSFVGVDDRYVIISTSCKSNFTFNQETINNNTNRTDTDKYAVLRKDSIGSGKEEWIEMYNGMFVQ